MEYLVIFFCLELIPSIFKNRRYKVESDLSKTFKKQDILLSVVLWLSIADKVGNTNKGDFDVVNINLLRYCLTKHGDWIGATVPQIGIAWLKLFI